MAEKVDESVRHPDTSYNTMYPYNKVITTEGGHQIEVDDTPGAERIRIGHKSGTYLEISSGGRLVQASAGHTFEYHKGGMTVSIDQNGDMKVNGGHRLSVSGDSHIEVGGDAHVACKGDMISAVNGNQTTMVNGNMFAKVAGDMTSKTDGDHNAQVMGNSTIQTAGDSTINTKGNSTIQSGGTLGITSEGAATITAPSIALNGTVYLGGTEGGKPVVQSTDKDSNGADVPSPASSKVFIVG